MMVGYTVPDRLASPVALAKEVDHLVVLFCSAGFEQDQAGCIVPVALMALVGFEEVHCSGFEKRPLVHLDAIGSEVESWTHCRENPKAVDRCKTTPLLLEVDQERKLLLSQAGQQIFQIQRSASSCQQ